MQTQSAQKAAKHSMLLTLCGLLVRCIGSNVQAGTVRLLLQLLQLLLQLLNAPLGEVLGLQTPRARVKFEVVEASNCMPVLQTCMPYLPRCRLTCTSRSQPLSNLRMAKWCSASSSVTRRCCSASYRWMRATDFSAA